MPGQRRQTPVDNTELLATLAEHFKHESPRLPLQIRVPPE